MDYLDPDFLAELQEKNSEFDTWPVCVKLT